MNRWGKGLLAALIAFGLAGCAKDGTVKESPDQKVAMPTAEELIAKITEAGKGLSSFVQESQTWSNINMAQSEKNDLQPTETNSTTEVVLSPLQMHQVSQIKLSGKGEQLIEQYYTDNRLFISIDGYWREMPEDISGNIGGIVQQSASPRERMEQLKTILPYLKVTEEGDDYVLSARGSGDQMKDFTAYYRVQYSGVELPDQQITDVKSMSTTYCVNKQTYLPTRTEDEMVTDDRAGGYGMYTETKTKTTIGKYNTLSKIEIPEEVLNVQR
ncbi:hypothetical protein PAECIP111892_05489 [Paenibacillus auburnensis]|uniref:Lipoprotein n=1 Tax=Paenibacillus auburnensis TaxID=2905649 RepID=A0ABN8H1N4_9BACL|nr:DUF6612 family protein [Paenibacillus auburnensis]CAH1224391.1 hypothetical protein PAECIP111892_05489 [Paenibacillus auburnensis]